MTFLSRHPLLVTALILAAILIALVFLFGWTLRTGSESHEFQYRVSISTESTLENVTLLLPVPFVYHTSSLGEALVKGEGYGIPPDWRLSLEWVNDTPMMRIFAGKIEPEYHGYPIPLEQGSTPIATPPPAATAYSNETPVLIPLDFGITQTVQRSIDTQNPINREPMLSNPELLKPIPCQNQPGRCYQYLVPVYVRYSSVEAGNLTISISDGGMNQWWVLGWSGNSYGDTVEVIPKDTRQGWIQAEGILSTGLGRY
ncbi:MAG TPA: hypothetical protein VKO45_05755 [Methanomicrobiales archaeon]|nr:hypothetical protein [Methanomicrobiales archaeon]